MSATPAHAASQARTSALAWAGRQRVTIALVLLIVFGALRYDHFLGAFNVLSVLRYNSMFALISLGQCFAIMGAGIDLSVGTTAAFASVVSAMLSSYGLFPGLIGGLSAGLAVGAHQRLHGHANDDPAVYRDAVGHAGGERAGAFARAQPVGLGQLRDRFHLARPGRPPRLSGPRLDRGRRLTSMARSCSTTRASGAMCSRSAAMRRRRGSWGCRSTG